MEVEVELAIDVITGKIAELMNQFATTQDKKTSNILKEKIHVLQQIKDELYLNNYSIAKNVLTKSKRGIL